MVELLTPDTIAPVKEKLDLLQENLNRVLLGRPELHKMVLIGIFSRGHILLEGVPGVGKTALIQALGTLLGLQFKRVQFTPDLMPGDITGTNLLQETPTGKRELVFQPGPVFTNILLADEINRASPKTQSALLEAMQERRVTAFGQTRDLPSPFFVLASQNPIELEGTYPLPEAQLDRFLFKLQVGSPSAETLTEIITSRRYGTPPSPEFLFSVQDWERTMALLRDIFLPLAVAKYISRLVSATAPDSADTIDLVRQYVSFGASPRAAIGLAEAARAAALFAGRPCVGFEDVRTVADAVLNHRILLAYRAKLDKISTSEIVKQLVDKLDKLDWTVEV